MAGGHEIILVPGLWYGPKSMCYIARELRRLGYGIRYFSYRSTRASAADCARSLAELVRASPVAMPHLVGHSLGGLLILRMLAMSGAPPAGRVVLLGTPVQGSEAARKTLRLPGGSALLGVAAATLCAGAHDVARSHEVGMIAGSRPIGLGRMAGLKGKDNDGTVALTETESASLTGRIILPLSHTGMLFSARVAREIHAFLEHGRFSGSHTGIDTRTPPGQPGAEGVT
jgi:pimeloyl-ACP methyl ester carboxylesterase